MNQASEQFRLGFSVYRDKGITKVDTRNGDTFELDGVLEIPR